MDMSTCICDAPKQLQYVVTADKGEKGKDD